VERAGGGEGCGVGGGIRFQRVRQERRQSKQGSLEFGLASFRTGMRNELLQSCLVAIQFSPIDRDK